MHLSRLAADLTLWATAEFGFVEFSDAFATGSSIMPQKKNPDVAELVRGKSGRLYGNLVAVLTTMKGLPLAYNSDMQEDKEPFFDSVDTLEAILAVVPPMIESLTFRTDRMRQAAGENFATATDLADYLVRKGVAFRQAHGLIGKIVRFCEAEGKPLDGLSLVELRRFSPLFQDDAKDALTVEASLPRPRLDRRDGAGGVRRSLALARTLIARMSRRGRGLAPCLAARPRWRWPPAVGRGRRSRRRCGRRSGSSTSSAGACTPPRSSCRGRRRTAAWTRRRIRDLALTTRIFRLEDGGGGEPRTGDAGRRT